MRVAALVLFLLATPAVADIWPEWHAKRVADPAGRYYVALRYHKAEYAARYSLAEIGEDAPPVDSEEYEAYENWTSYSVGSGLREGDRVIRRGGLTSLPYEVLVSATGLGFVAIEAWGSFGYEDSVTIVKADGSPVIAKKLADLFTSREIDAFPRSVSSIWWLRGAWIDDGARTVVVVSRDGKLRTVSLDNGEVGEGADEDMVRALSLRYPDARRLALDLARERGIAAAGDAARSLLSDGTEPLSIRLRAAAALAAIGDPRGKDLIVRHADPERALDDDEDAAFALAHLPDVLGEKAIPLLTEAIRKEAPGADWGFYALGPRAVPVLLRLAGEAGNSSAIDVLGWLGVREALSGLARAISMTESEWTAKDALRLMGHLGEPDEVATALVDTLCAGSPIPDSVSAAFENASVSEEAVTRLARVLAEPPDHLDEIDRLAVAAALRFQTGEDLGIDPGAWRRWLEERER